MPDGTALRVIFLVEGRTTPSSRLRVTAHLPALRGEGFVAEIAEIPRAPITRMRRFLGLGRYDVVVVQKKVLRGWELALAARCAPRLVYDFDDAVTVGPHAERPDPRRTARFVAMLARCTAVIAGNDELATYARGHPLVRIIPTGIDVETYRPKADQSREAEGGRPVVIGWIGTSGNLRYLDPLRPVFDELRRVGKAVQLKVVADRAPERGSLPLHFERWTLKTEPTALQGFDIGVMPLDDTAWSRGKCGFKLLQYMAAGLPAVASPVGVNRSIIQDGENGLLADTPDEWSDALGRLIENSSLRSRLGRAARRTVETRYSLARCSDALVAVLREVCERRPVRAPSAPAMGSKEAVNV
jgi:glycosyltransferase involved in cell wall biosynthesis